MAGLHEFFDFAAFLFAFFEFCPVVVLWFGVRHRRELFSVFVVTVASMCVGVFQPVITDSGIVGRSGCGHSSPAVV